MAGGLRFRTSLSIVRGFGFSLPVVYLVWLAVVILCYFPSRWFAGVKQRSRSPWLSYL